MASKRIIFITGGNTGLGYEAVKALYKSSSAYEIIIGSRSKQNADSAISSLQSEIKESPSTLSSVQVDLEADDSIKQAYDTISSNHDRLDVLINNGGAGFDREIQEGNLTLREGWNKAWNINVAGTQVLTTMFIPLLLKSNDPRLLFVTSGTATLAETERFDNPIFARINASPAAGWPKPDEANPIMAYRSAKTGLNMMMRQWHRILKEDGVKVWAISPGFLATGLGGVGEEKLKKMGAKDPSVGGEFMRDVVAGKRDEDVGKVIRVDMVQPW